jgi:heme-degrading monooxygenase HmoA
MIISSVKIHRKSEGRKDVLAILRSLDWDLKEIPGCLESSLTADRRGDSEHLVQIALWRSEADLARFIRSDSFYRLIAALELSETLPEVRFHQIQHTRGMEYIESLRGAVCG